MFPGGHHVFKKATLENTICQSFVGFDIGIQTVFTKRLKMRMLHPQQMLFLSSS